MGPKAWKARLKSLGQALLELLQAEIGALNADLKGSAGQLARALALFALAAFLAFWVIGGLAYGAVEVLALWLPRWGAVFVVTGVWALVAVVLVAVGRARLRRLEAPAQTVKRHIASHKEFVARELLSAEDQPLESRPAREGEGSGGRG